MPRYALVALLLAVACFLPSCLESPVLPGTVARVNGQDIYFSDLETRRASLFASTSEHPGTHDDASLGPQYRYALGQMMAETLVCQYMRERGFELEDGALEAEEKRIRDDYPEGAFDLMLLERGVSLERWRGDIARRLLVERFVSQVLRPEISITADEVQAYYSEHSGEFTIPEQWHFLHVSAENRKEAERALARLAAGEDPEIVQKELLVTIHDVRMGMELLPEHITGALMPLRAGQASKVAGTGKEFWAVRLIEVLPSSMLDAAEISKRVELALSENKMRGVYEAWVLDRLEKSEIHIAPAFVRQTEPGADTPALSGKTAVPGVPAIPPIPGVGTRGE